jgi:hypothetical protein
MTSKTFTSGVVIDSGWLNDVNNTTYNKTFSDGSVALSALPGSVANSNLVGYTPAGTGAVGTTVQTKLRENVSVLDFGADATGATDSQSAFTKAIAAVSTVGGVVNVPPGLYVFATGLVLDNLFNVTIQGAGGRNVGGYTNGSTLRYTGTGTTFISLKSSYGCSLNDLEIQFSSASFTGDLIDFSHAASANDSAFGQVINCYVGSDTGARTTGNGIKLDKAIEVMIMGCSFAGGASAITGQSSAGSSYSNQITIMQNQFVNSVSAPVLYGGEAWSFLNNTFEQRSTGVAGAFLNTTLTPANGFSFIGNWCGDATSGASSWLTIFGNGINVSGNRIIGGTIPNSTGITFDSVHGYSVTGNNFDGLVTAVAFGATAGTIDGFESGNSFTGCTNIYGSVSNQTSFSQATPGYTRLPNGMLMQWGTSSVTAGTPLTVTWPKAFSTACYSVTTGMQSPASNANVAFFTGPSTTTMTLNVNGTGVSTVNWQVIGK